jgi:hypothetical protein
MGTLAIKSNTPRITYRTGIRFGIGSFKARTLPHNRKNFTVPEAVDDATSIPRGLPKYLVSITVSLLRMKAKEHPE